ncbi:outer membrane protein assembly factor BamA [Orrella daihaiensis]|uniref:Outer membrane protein assembly factor BamA n=1 Tax=Orrella daihaiensis TaxID=2782176 RepID=A0ABY4AGG3_9BURK|nr:outer membrane protein assembly factor BamA [Orrella daihaiensis]UOD49366.1 outer membrane protein assembly factor BamA [Orrella daihaiensis]
MRASQLGQPEGKILKLKGLLAFFLVAVVLAVPSLASAFTPFKVKDIRVDGIQRTEAGTVFAYVPVKVGDTFTEEMATDIIRELYSTGFFSDVRISTANDIVVVTVQERPVIASISFTGMREFESKQIIEAFQQVGFGEGRIFDQAMLEQAEFELQQQYLSKAKYGVEITATTTPLPRNRVGVNFDVFEGSVAKIKEIRIIGNEAFSEGDLLDLMQLTTSGYLTWYTDTDKYSREKLEADMESIRSFYLDRGYLEFSMETPQVTISPDRQDIYITISISEGKPYTVSDVQLAGNLLSLDQEIEALVTIKAGETFSGAKSNETSVAIRSYLGDLGYAFANVNPNPVLDREKQTVALTFFVDPSRRVYVRKVEITGNERTRDTVARREIRQLEAAWYDGGAIKLSKERLERLGYFQEVDVTTEPVPGSVDQVDVNVKVTERQTGAINLGIGYGQTDGVILSAGISEKNVFGSGTELDFSVNTSQDARTFVLSHTDPYWTLDGVSRTTSGYYRTVTPSLNNPGNYEVISAGGGFNFGVPISEFDRVSLGLNFEHNKISLYEDSPLAYEQYVDAYGDATNTPILSAGWSKDTRDSVLNPTRGSFTRLSATVGTVSLKYYMLSAQHQHFIPIGRDYTLAFNALFDYGDVYNSDNPFPVIKDVFAGGIGTVRGYQGNSLGPKDPRTGTYLGGSRRVVGNVQFFFPLPGSGRDKTLRLFVFGDAGQVYGTGAGNSSDTVDFGDLRYSTGFGMSWLSPMGPLQLVYAKALNAKEGDETQVFQFQVGSAF